MPETRSCRWTHLTTNHFLFSLSSWQYKHKPQGPTLNPGTLVFFSQQVLWHGHIFVKLIVVSEGEISLSNQAIGLICPRRVVYHAHVRHDHMIPLAAAPRSLQLSRILRVAGETSQPFCVSSFETTTQKKHLPCLKYDWNWLDPTVWAKCYHDAISFSSTFDHTACSSCNDYFQNQNQKYLFYCVPVNQVLYKVQVK